MEQYEDWMRLLEELPGMVRFALIFYGVVSVLIVGGLAIIAVQLHRLVGAVGHGSRTDRGAPAPSQPTASYGQPQPQQPFQQHQPPPGNNPYYPPRQP